MRPRKVILCVGADEVRMSVRVFLLETRGFRALMATSAKEALAVLRAGLPGAVDLLLVDLPLIDLSDDVFLQARKLQPGLPTLATCDRAEKYETFGADAVLRAVSPAELIERVKILVAGRRGPRKKPVGSVLCDASRESRAA